MILRLFLLFCFGFTFAQKTDSIALNVHLDVEKNELKVEQHFFIYNHSEKVLTNFYLHAWANAYSGRGSVLNKTKLEDRKKDLYFANKAEKGGIFDLKIINTSKQNWIKGFDFKKREFLLLELEKPLAPKHLLKFTAEYTIKIPHQKFTGYGYDEMQNYVLKYFFLEPAPMENNRWILQNYKDFESVAAYPTNYSVQMNFPDEYFVYSDLNQIGNQWVGNQRNHFRFQITKEKKKNITITPKNEVVSVDFGYELDSKNDELVESLVGQQLNFLSSKLGEVPENKLLITAKTRKKENFFGVDDVDAWITTLRLFTEQEKTSLKLFQPLSYEYIDALFASDKRKDHWIKNGLHTYLQMRYVDDYFPDLKLSGGIADSIKVFGIKPLKYFQLSKLKMNDRYKLIYLFMVRQNFDQPIDTPLDELSNFNQLVISSFKAGISFYYLSEYLGEDHFDELMRGFIHQYRGKLVTKVKFRNYMILNSKKDLTWFFDDYLPKRDKINYKLQRTVETDSALQIKIKNRTGFTGPFKIVGVKNDSVVASEWYISDQKKISVNFPKGEYDKLILNPDYLFPEFNDRDNSLRTKGLFKNSKKIQFKLYNDIENPEYNQIYVLPQFRWNNYDKLLLGLNFRNSSPLPRRFSYSISPKYSTGQSELTGSGSLRYSILPDHGWFRQIQFRTGFSYEHFNEDQAFRSLAAGVVFNFNKPFRTDRNHGVAFSYNNIDREVLPGETQTDEDKYSLWNLSYSYTNRRIIHDFEGFLRFQTTESFQKVFAEAYYRWQIFENYRLGFRFFGGKFINNDTDTDFFDFGTSFITDYTFSYPLLGRSETEGLLSQQFVLAEGGFKSDFEVLVNDWIVSTNVEIPVWRMFDLYVDAGFYHNEDQPTEFIYGTGLRVRVIPDFLELFLPIQSSLGFEPSLGNYHEAIRFTLNLDLGRVIAYLRRGKF